MIETRELLVRLRAVERRLRARLCLHDHWAADRDFCLVCGLTGYELHEITRAAS